MERILAGDLGGHVGSRVRLQGWLHHQRQLAQVGFVLLRDRSGIAQVVVADAGLRQRLTTLASESVIEVVGDVVESEQAPTGVEVVEPEITVLTEVTQAPALELRRPVLNAQLPTLLDQAAVALRHPPRRAVAQIASASVAGFRSVLEQLGFTEIFTPKVVASATESGANVFPIDWFGSEAYLAQSPQFYKQMLVGVFERVYEVGPVFRAEPHDTARHLAEYVSLDAEMGFITDHRDVMAVLGEVLAGMCDAIVERATPEVELLDLELPSMSSSIPILDFVEAQEMIEAATGRTTLGEPDLAPADERWLGEWARTEHGSEPPRPLPRSSRVGRVSVRIPVVHAPDSPPITLSAGSGGAVVACQRPGTPDSPAIWAVAPDAP